MDLPQRAKGHSDESEIICYFEVHGYGRVCLHAWSPESWKRSCDFCVIKKIQRQVKNMGAILTIREDLAKRLETLAKTIHKSKSSLATEAIEEFLAVQEWHIQAIKE